MRRLDILIWWLLCIANLGISDTSNVIQDVETWNHEGLSLKARIALPKGKGPFPVVMAIHGGAFSGGDRLLFDYSFFEHYTDMGVAVMSVEYRLTINSEGGQYPNAIKDCMHNLHWLRDHAKEYKFDINRVILQGSSAGAYLAMMVALTCDKENFQPDFGPYQEQKASVAAVISSAAIYDWTTISNGSNFIGSYRSDPDASPIHYTSGGSCSAFLLLGGSDDRDWSLPISTRQMQENLQKSDAYCELYLKSNQKHPAFYGVSDEFSKWGWQKVDPFVAKVILY